MSNMSKEKILQNLQDCVDLQRKNQFDHATEPPGWGDHLLSIADKLKAAYPDYANDKAVVMLLIEAGAISNPEAMALPESIRSDRDVALTFATKDPMRFDMADVIPAKYRSDKAFVMEAVNNPHPDALMKYVSPELRQDADVVAAAKKSMQPSLSDMIRDAVTRSPGHSKSPSELTQER